MNTLPMTPAGPRRRQMVEGATGPPTASAAVNYASISIVPFGANRY